MPLSLYLNGLDRLIPKLTQDVLGRPPARLLRHRAQLRQRRPVVVPGGDVRDIAHRVDARVALDGQVGPDVEPSATAGGRPGVLRDGRAGLAAAPHHGPGRDRAAVVELDPVGVNGGHADLQLDDRAGLGQLA